MLAKENTYGMVSFSDKIPIFVFSKLHKCN